MPFLGSCIKLILAKNQEAPKGLYLGHLGCHLGQLGRHLGHLGPHLGDLGPHLGHLGGSFFHGPTLFIWAVKKRGPGVVTRRPRWASSRFAGALS